jgi:tetratricopeptide (TPR) repeat protein
MPKFLLVFALAVSALFFSAPSFAQDSEMGLAKLSAADEKRYREILEKPIDENQLNLKKIDAYKEKENAFLMLGETAGREENLIAWSKIDPDGKWSLRAYWGLTGKYEDAIRIGNEIINESKFPPSSARIRLYMAVDYLQINQIDKAKELLDKAESIIKYDFGRVPRNSGTVIWIIRAETEFYAYKSVYLSRIGKAEEALTMARLALEKSKELLKLIPNALAATSARPNATGLLPKDIVISSDATSLPSNAS